MSARCLENHRSHCEHCEKYEVLAEGVQHAFASCEVAAAQYAVLLPYCMLKVLPGDSPDTE